MFQKIDQAAPLSILEIQPIESFVDTLFKVQMHLATNNWSTCCELSNLTSFNVFIYCIYIEFSIYCI